MKLLLIILLSISQDIYCYTLSSLSCCSASSFARSRLQSSMNSNNNQVNTGSFEDSIISDEEDNKHDDAIGMPIGPLPTVSSKINFGEESLSIQHDLWVVGAGTLGEYICKQWKVQFPNAKVIAETKSTTRHSSLSSLGVECRLRADRTLEDEKTAKFVVICLPPSMTEDYVSEISDSARIWVGPLGKGNLIFTSSIGVYGESNGNTVDEKFRLDTRSKQSTRLIAAEEAILLRDGNVIRLAGLYTATRGPHTFWLNKSKSNEKIQTNANGLVNLLHYEDAAAATVSALLAIDRRKSIYLASDGKPISRSAICEAALASKQYPDALMPTFESEDGTIGKVCNGEWTRKTLNWEPKHKSFTTFMRRLGGEIIDEAAEDALASKESKAAKKKTSALWLPGDEDEDVDIIIN